MLDTSARLLRLLGLLQTRSFWSGSDLAERLEVTQRTLRRDVDRLRSLGYPVHSSAGVAGGYQLGSGSKLPPLLLEDTEALAVAMSLRTAAVGSVSGLQEAAVSALIKLEQVLPSRLRKSLTAFRTVVSPLEFAGPSVHPDTLSQLASACRNDDRLRFTYESLEGTQTRREVEPHGVVHTGARWYLVAWDLGREDWRTFRVDRIQSEGLSVKGRFVRRVVPGGDIARYVSRSVAVQPYPFTAKVVLRAPKSALSPRVPPTFAQLTEIDEHSCLLETGAGSLLHLALHVAALDVDFEIQEPDELRAVFVRLSERLSRVGKPQAPA